MSEHSILLSGVVGSTAYGLATEDSDIDRLGVFAAPTEALLGLDRVTESHVSTNPDVTLHEAGKFCRLALQCNPTVTELLWLQEYEVAWPLGNELLDICASFLSASRVRSAYLGYARQQFKKIEFLDGHRLEWTPAKVAKSARHMYRLLAQGLELWTRGSLEVALADPDAVMSFGQLVAGGDIATARSLLHRYVEAFDGHRTVLPDEPDKQAVEAWLQKVRREYYNEEKETV